MRQPTTAQIEAFRTYLRATFGIALEVERFPRGSIHLHGVDEHDRFVFTYLPVPGTLSTCIGWQDRRGVIEAAIASIFTD